ncbi:uncharacterized protein LOC115622921 isoform X2 [Scaptodrosophila lebanonensis]|uniref:Uncharacterized protein LOC115622921 isoform X2 n=1 Tax=Drosophila lebanonensis TaxID=7225 RepID=A0A6J2TBZ1_DROLE|nr:uncharacterized protein LOC115622921 isoform X2 [Scaptodrosophila lebanonensis]
MCNFNSICGTGHCRYGCYSAYCGGRCCGYRRLEKLQYTGSPRYPCRLQVRKNGIRHPKLNMERQQRASSSSDSSNASTIKRRLTIESVQPSASSTRDANGSSMCNGDNISISSKVRNSAGNKCPGLSISSLKTNGQAVAKENNLLNAAQSSPKTTATPRPSCASSRMRSCVSIRSGIETDPKEQGAAGGQQRRSILDGARATTSAKGKGSLDSSKTANTPKSRCTHPLHSRESMAAAARSSRLRASSLQQQQKLQTEQGRRQQSQQGQQQQQQRQQLQRTQPKRLSVSRNGAHSSCTCFSNKTMYPRAQNSDTNLMPARTSYDLRQKMQPNASQTTIKGLECRCFQETESKDQRNSTPCYTCSSTKTLFRAEMPQRKCLRSDSQQPTRDPCCNLTSRNSTQLKSFPKKVFYYNRSDDELTRCARERQPERDQCSPSTYNSQCTPCSLSPKRWCACGNRQNQESVTAEPCSICCCCNRPVREIAKVEPKTFKRGCSLSSDPKPFNNGCKPEVCIRKKTRKAVVRRAPCKAPPDPQEGNSGIWFECNVPLRVNMPTSICMDTAPSCSTNVAARQCPAAVPPVAAPTPRFCISLQPGFGNCCCQNEPPAPVSASKPKRKRALGQRRAQKSAPAADMCNTADIGNGCNCNSMDGLPVRKVFERKVYCLDNSIVSEKVAFDCKGQFGLNETSGSVPYPNGKTPCSCVELHKRPSLPAGSKRLQSSSWRTLGSKCCPPKRPQLCRKFSEKSTNVRTSCNKFAGSSGQTPRGIGPTANSSNMQPRLTSKPKITPSVCASPENMSSFNCFHSQAPAFNRCATQVNRPCMSRMQQWRPSCCKCCRLRNCRCNRTCCPRMRGAVHTAAFKAMHVVHGAAMMRPMVPAMSNLRRMCVAGKSANTATESKEGGSSAAAAKSLVSLRAGKKGSAISKRSLQCTSMSKVGRSINTMKQSLAQLAILNKEQADMSNSIKPKPSTSNSKAMKAKGKPSSTDIKQNASKSNIRVLKKASSKQSQNTQPPMSTVSSYVADSTAKNSNRMQKAPEEWSRGSSTVQQREKEGTKSSEGVCGCNFTMAGTNIDPTQMGTKSNMDPRNMQSMPPNKRESQQQQAQPDTGSMNSNAPQLTARKSRQPPNAIARDRDSSTKPQPSLNTESCLPNCSCMTNPTKTWPTESRMAPQNPFGKPPTFSGINLNGIQISDRNTTASQGGFDRPSNGNWRNAEQTHPSANTCDFRCEGMNSYQTQIPFGYNNASQNRFEREPPNMWSGRGRSQNEDGQGNNNFGGQAANTWPSRDWQGTVEQRQSSPEYKDCTSEGSYSISAAKRNVNPNQMQTGNMAPQGRARSESPNTRSAREWQPPAGNEDECECDCTCKPGQMPTSNNMAPRNDFERDAPNEWPAIGWQNGNEVQPSEYRGDWETDGSCLTDDGRMYLNPNRATRGNNIAPQERFDRQLPNVDSNRDWQRDQKPNTSGMGYSTGQNMAPHRGQNWGNDNPYSGADYREPVRNQRQANAKANQAKQTPMQQAACSSNCKCSAEEEEPQLQEKIAGLFQSAFKGAKRLSEQVSKGLALPEKNQNRWQRSPSQFRTCPTDCNCYPGDNYGEYSAHSMNNGAGRGPEDMDQSQLSYPLEETCNDCQCDSNWNLDESQWQQDLQFRPQPTEQFRHGNFAAPSLEEEPLPKQDSYDMPHVPRNTRVTQESDSSMFMDDDMQQRDGRVQESVPQRAQTDSQLATNSQNEILSETNLGPSSSAMHKNSTDPSPDNRVRRPQLQMSRVGPNAAMPKLAPQHEPHRVSWTPKLPTNRGSQTEETLSIATHPEGPKATTQRSTSQGDKRNEGALKQQPTASTGRSGTGNRQGAAQRSTSKGDTRAQKRPSGRNVASSDAKTRAGKKTGKKVSTFLIPELNSDMNCNRRCPALMSQPKFIPLSERTLGSKAADRPRLRYKHADDDVEVYVIKESKCDCSERNSFDQRIDRELERSDMADFGRCMGQRFRRDTCVVNEFIQDPCTTHELQKGGSDLQNRTSPETSTDSCDCSSPEQSVAERDNDSIQLVSLNANESKSFCSCFLTDLEGYCTEPSNDNNCGLDKQPVVLVPFRVNCDLKEINGICNSRKVAICDPACSTKTRAQEKARGGNASKSQPQRPSSARPKYPTTVEQTDTLMLLQPRNMKSEVSVKAPDYALGQNDALQPGIEKTLLIETTTTCDMNNYLQACAGTNFSQMPYANMENIPNMEQQQLLQQYQPTDEQQKQSYSEMDQQQLQEQMLNSCSECNYWLDPRAPLPGSQSMALPYPQSQVYSQQQSAICCATGGNFNPHISMAQSNLQNTRIPIDFYQRTVTKYGIEPMDSYFHQGCQFNPRQFNTNNNVYSPYDMQSSGTTSICGISGMPCPYMQQQQQPHQQQQQQQRGQENQHQQQQQQQQVQQQQTSDDVPSCSSHSMCGIRGQTCPCMQQQPNDQHMCGMNPTCDGFNSYKRS